jgi:hypothetical protein
LEKLDVLAARAQSIASDGAQSIANPPEESDDADDSSRNGFAAAATRAASAVAEHTKLAEAEADVADGGREEAVAAPASNQGDGGEPLAVFVPADPVARAARRRASPDVTLPLASTFGLSAVRPSAQDQSTAAATRAIFAPQPQHPSPPQPPSSLQPTRHTSPQPSPPVASAPRSPGSSGESRAGVALALEALAREAEDDFRAAMRAIGASPPRSPSPDDASPPRDWPRVRRAVGQPLSPEARSPPAALTSRANPAEDAAADALIGRYTQWRRRDELSAVGAAARAVLEDAAPGLEVYGGHRGGLLDLVARSVLERAREAAEVEARERREAQQAAEDARREAQEDAAAAAAEAEAHRKAEEEAEAEAAYAADQDAEKAASAAAEAARKQAAAGAAAEASAEEYDADRWRRVEAEFGEAREAHKPEPATPPCGVASTAKQQVSPGSLQRQLLAELHLHETLVASQLQVRQNGGSGLLDFAAKL